MYIVYHFVYGYLFCVQIKRWKRIYFVYVFDIKSKRKRRYSENEMEFDFVWIRLIIFRFCLPFSYLLHTLTITFAHAHERHLFSVWALFFFSQFLRYGSLVWKSFDYWDSIHHFRTTKICVWQNELQSAMKIESQLLTSQ